MYKFLTFYKKSCLTTIYDVGLTSDFRCVWPTIQAVKIDHDRRNIDTSGVFFTRLSLRTSFSQVLRYTQINSDL